VVRCTTYSYYYTCGPQTSPQKTVFNLSQKSLETSALKSSSIPLS